MELPRPLVIIEGTFGPTSAVTTAIALFSHPRPEVVVVDGHIAAAQRRRTAGTTAVASALGVMVGVSGLDHGFFEMLQGNAATGSLIVKAIGPDQRMWVHGTEEAFTVVPAFLATGILAVATAVALIVWSVRCIDRPNGSGVFLALAGLLFLVGGGVAMIVFVFFGWAVARRIGRPITWWRALPAVIAGLAARGWRPLIAACALLYAFALEIAIAGVVPGCKN